MNESITRIINEEIRTFTRNVIVENSKDRKLNRFIKAYFNGAESFKQTRDILMNTLYRKIPDMRSMTNIQALMNVITSFFNKDGSCKVQQDTLASFNYILHYVATKEPERLSELETSIADTNLLQDMDRLKLEFGPEGQEVRTDENTEKTTRTPNGYTVTRIDSFEDMEDWQGIGWCVADGEEWFEDYVGIGTAYVCENENDIDWDEPELKEADELYMEYYTKSKEFYECLEDPRCGCFGSGKFPYDQNGLSTLFVIAWPDGRISTYSRWNIDAEDGKYLTEEQLSQVLGMDASKVCRPTRK